MRIDVLTLFPKMFKGVLDSSILKRAANPHLRPHASNLKLPLASYHLHDIRQYSSDKHQKVDQPPYGGGPGMVMQCQPVWDTVQAVEAQDDRPAMRVLMSPQGQRLDQPKVDELACQPRVLIIAGHYEGIDDRVIQKLAPIHEISIGDYVLSGGELPAMVLIDAIVRLIPGVLGDEASAEYESFSRATHGLLDHPHYTRPAEWMGLKVPNVLLSGNHAKIAAWRLEQSRQRTVQRRPDLTEDSLPSSHPPPA